MNNLTEILSSILADFKTNIENRIENIKLNENNSLVFDSGWINFNMKDIKIKNEIGKDAFFVVLQKANNNIIVFTHTNNNKLTMYFDKKYIYLKDSSTSIRFSPNFKTQVRVLGFKIK